MEKKKIFILVGNSDLDSISGMLASAYEDGAREAGHEVRRTNIGEMSFDPILHKGYKEIQELEPDLIKVQEDFTWADHIVILYPNWWCTMPAILKGMFDRMWLPGFAFNFKKDAEGKRTNTVVRMLKGKSARVIITSGTRPLFLRVQFGDYTNEIARGILGFAGVAPVRISTIGPCEHASDERMDVWKEEVRRLGERVR
ncbi:MAG: NAD(P)H-dependent oxidoreductase [Candidatus Pacebacteria bacterium]|nr:NAD(P)H-dependent oxidoreductase [Candidatus Paceibacterota bacterium]